MASQGLSSLYGTGWLFGAAMLTSLLWYLFWMVLSPVELDISDLINWYFFAKLQLRDQYDIYGVLRVIHKWLPLLIITSLILSKVSLIYREYFLKLAQVVYVLACGYNLALLLLMLFVGRKVIELFSLTLPLFLLLHAGPVLSYLFSPRTLWLTSSLSLLLSCLLFRHTPSSEQRGHKGCGFWDLTAVGAGKRVIATFSVPLLLMLLTVWVMEKGCVPCTATPGFGHQSLPRPSLVAHRGCALDFPENSLAAFEQAVLLDQVGGLETDVSVSMDGVLYLMHDLHLIRTTDVVSKCPSHDPYSNASMLYYHNGSCPLGQLNVGDSFLHSLSALPTLPNSALYHAQLLPTFTQFLEVAKRAGKTIIFDVSIPPVGHPYHHSIFNRTMDHILASGLPHSKVWWLPSAGRRWVHNNYPNMILTTKTALTAFEDLKSEHIDKINDDWSTSLETFRRYQHHNLTINMFFVESVFMYDYAWCVGVESVTTSNCRLLSKPHTNSFLQICTEWESCLAQSHSLMLGGLLLLLVQFLIMSVWEGMRVSGRCLTR